jgi:hypothetical protein
MKKPARFVPWFLLVCIFQFSPAHANSGVSGTWHAAYSDKTGSGETIVHLVELSDGMIAGTFSSTPNVGGSIEGRVDGDRLILLLRLVSEDCPGQFTLSVTMTGGTASGTYTGFDCNGDRGSGVIAMTRSRDSSSSGPPQSNDPKQPVYEYGESSELADVRTVIVFAEDDEEARQLIANQIRGSGLMKVVDDPAHADAAVYFFSQKVHLGYGSHTVTQGHRNPSYPTFQNTYSVPLSGEAGFGYVFQVPEPGRVRILWEFEATKKRRGQKSPEKRFVKNFLEVLREVRGIKK